MVDAQTFAGLARRFRRRVNSIMFKIFMVLCIAGTACLPMAETDGRTYRTEKACWSALTKKMELMEQVGQDPDFRSLSAACIKAE